MRRHAETIITASTMRQAAPLAAAVAAHTTAGGAAYLLSRPRPRRRGAEDLAEGGEQGGGGAAEGWEGLSSLLALLGESGECSSRPLTLVSNEGSTELLLTRWTPQVSGIVHKYFLS